MKIEKNAMENKRTCFPFLMLLFLFLILCVSLLLPQQASAKSTKQSKIRVLFVGDSKTYASDIPLKFSKIAKAEGKKVQVTTIAIAGKSLTYLARHEAKAIQMKKYDYVILQERTVNLTKYSAYLKGARRITKLVKAKNPNVQMVVRKTWVTKTSSWKKRKTAYQNSEKVADRIDAIISEDGPAFDLCTEFCPDIKLYKDNKHPTKAGAYLSACCLYAAIFQKSPVGCTYTAGMEEKTAKTLQKIARIVTF